MIIQNKEQPIPFSQVWINDVFKYKDFLFLKTDTVEDYDNNYNCWNLSEKNFDCFEGCEMVIPLPEAKLII